MRRIFIIIPLFFLWTGFDNPCNKKIIKKDETTIFLYYPSCKDSSTYFSRTFEKGILINEIWVNNNRPAGIENKYSMNKNNLITSTYFWGTDPRQFSISYFTGTNRLSEFQQTLRDSTHFNIRFYVDGSVKSYGLTNQSYCNFGIWTEIDSLGRKRTSRKCYCYYQLVLRERQSMDYDRRSE